MTIYKCETCKYTTQHKGTFLRHLEKLNKCVTGEIISISKQEYDDIVDDYLNLIEENNQLLQLVDKTD